MRRVRPSSDEDEEMDCEQREELWKHEIELRLRTAGLTYMEYLRLRELPECGEERKGMLTVLAGWERFIQSHNTQTRVQALAVLDRWCLEACRRFGTEQVQMPTDKYQWSLLKLKSVHQDLLIPDSAKKGCYCLAETQFRPWGCGCNELHTEALTIQNCHKCAICLRCYG